MYMFKAPGTHLELFFLTATPNEFWLQTPHFFGSLGRVITYKKTYAGSLLSETLIEDSEK